MNLTEVLTIDLSGLIPGRDINDFGVIVQRSNQIQFDSSEATFIDSIKIDSTHVMLFWAGSGSAGFCQIFEINFVNGTITALSSAVEFDSTLGVDNSAFLIDSTHVMNFWRGSGNDGFCQIFEITASTGTITPLGSAVEFDTTLATANSAFLIDSTHCMNFWQGTDSDGFCRMFEFDTSDGSITPLDSALEFDTVFNNFNSALLLDSTHATNFWNSTVGGGNGVCQVFEFNVSTGVVTALDSPLEFEASFNSYNSAIKINATRVVNFWQGSGGLDGFTRMFSINLTTGVITAMDSAVEFDADSNSFNSAELISSTTAINFWTGTGTDGFAKMFRLNADSGVITPLTAALEFETDFADHNSAVLINENNVANFWSNAADLGQGNLFTVFP